MKHPSLLQYSLNSLQSKLEFLTKELHIPEEFLSRVISRAPVILGLSLEENLRPTITTLKKHCGLSSVQIGEIITTCPTILTLSIKRKIDPCLYFLITNLSISSTSELGNLILCTPRILLQGVETSLARKIDMIKNAIEEENQGLVSRSYVQTEMAKVIKANPALLATTNSILEKRLAQCAKDPKKSLSIEFTKSTVGRKRMFLSSPMLDVSSFDDAKDEEMIDPIEEKYLDKTLPDVIRLSAFVSASVYPPDNLGIARGKRRSGGLAIMLPQLHENSIDFDFYSAIKSSFGLTMPEREGGSNLSKNLVLVGFPFLRPSRNRCDLYACHGALKVILQLIKQIRDRKEWKDTKVIVSVCTNSSYAWKLLRNTTKLEHWGSISSTEDFVFDGVGSPAMANLDLLFPLTKTVNRIVNNEIMDSSGAKISIGDITITFRHSGDIQSSYKYINEVNSFSVKAAKWQFDKG